MKLSNVHGLARRERGASLLVSLVFLVVMTTLGTTLANVSNLEERMASNTRDRDLALQAAEAALADAAYQIANNPTRRAAATTFVPTNANTAAYWETCFTGFTGVCTTHYPPAQTLPTSGPGAVWQQPQYVIERLPDAGTTQIYRVTARGVGRTSTSSTNKTTASVVVLQAVYGFS